MCGIVQHTHISLLQNLSENLHGGVRARENKAAMYPCPCDYHGYHGEYEQPLFPLQVVCGNSNLEGGREALEHVFCNTILG
jgi:hypothetical protein